MTRSNIIILGPPGSGKDTQIYTISKKIDAAVVSTGDIARNLASLDSPLGKKVKETLNQGKLLDDDLISKELENKIKDIDKEKSIIFNGYPRDISQAERLKKTLFYSGEKVNRVVFLDVPEKELIRRLSTRLVCKRCNRSFPPSQDKCTFCKGKLVKRDDDTSKNKILKRLQVYSEQTEPLVRYYERTGVLLAVNGDQSPSDVTKDILKILEEE